MTRISLSLPGIVQVQDKEDEHGCPVRVLYILDHPVAYYTPNSDTDGMRSEDWEDITEMVVSRFLGNLLIKAYPESWSRNNPTGNEIFYQNTDVNYVKEGEDW